VGNSDRLDCKGLLAGERKIKFERTWAKFSTLDVGVLDYAMQLHS